MRKDGERRKTVTWHEGEGEIRLHCSEFLEFLPDDALNALRRSDIYRRDVLQGLADAVAGSMMGYTWLDDAPYGDWYLGRRAVNEIRENLLPLMPDAAAYLVAHYREEADQYKSRAQAFRRHVGLLEREWPRGARDDRPERPDREHLHYDEEEGYDALQEFVDRVQGKGVLHYCAQCGNMDLAPLGAEPECNRRRGGCGGTMVEALDPDAPRVPIMQAEWRGGDGERRRDRMRCFPDPEKVRRRIKALWGEWPAGDSLEVRCLGPDLGTLTRLGNWLHDDRRVVAQSWIGDRVYMGRLTEVGPSEKALVVEMLPEGAENEVRVAPETVEEAPDA